MLFTNKLELKEGVQKVKNITAKLRKVNFAKDRKVLNHCFLSLRTFAKP